ncbi:MAG: TolC family protein [Candidatus Omnitrophota bacterium]|nr:MAG: TolC family protein [Candidatus Omnitrophota bacterium]
MKVSSKYIIIVFLFIAVPSILWAQSENFLYDLVSEVLQNNPQLKALKKEWESKKAKITSEKSLPQPEFGFTYYGESVETRVGPMRRKYSVKQPIPFPTKLSLKGKIAKKEAEIAYAKYILGVRGLTEQLKAYFYDYYFVVRSIHILSAEKLILESIRKSIQTKYEALKASQQDLVKADLEITKIEDKILGLRKQENLLRAQINRILDRPQGTAIDIPLGYTPTPKELQMEKTVLLEKAHSESPHILLERIALQKQDYKFSLAKQGYIPDFSIMAEYIEIGEGKTSSANDGKDAWMVGLSVRVPLWFWKIRSEVESEKKKRDAQKFVFEDKENFLSFKIEDLFFRLKTEEQLVDLYENVILPQAEHNFSVSRIGYESGSVDFLSFLDAERNLISIKIAELKQIVDYKKTIAQLEYIIGEDLE